MRTIELPWADFTTDEDLSWQRFARCHETDPDAFFPEKGGSNAAAKRICAACGVQQLCLEFALTHPETGKWGIWGGTSEPERRRMRADRKNLKEAA